MPKRINLPVNKLLNHPQKQSKQPQQPINTHKPVTFEQLFQQARKQHQSHTQSAH